MTTANTRTAVQTEYADTGLEDMLMQCDEQAFAVVASWPHLQISLQWSPRLASWLHHACQAELDRRALKTTRFPSLDVVNDWSNAEVAGGLALSVMWCDSAVDPMSEQVSRKIRNAMVATTTSRLLDGEPEDEPCDHS